MTAGIARMIQQKLGDDHEDLDTARLDPWCGCAGRLYQKARSGNAQQRGARQRVWVKPPVHRQGGHADDQTQVGCMPLTRTAHTRVVSGLFC